MIAIVGGGISGLSLAFELLQRGKDPVVFESSGRVGGLIGSRVEAGFQIETGPNSILDREPTMRALVEALELTPRVRQATAAVKRRFVFGRGAIREVPSSPPALLKSDLLSLPGKLRLLLEPFSGRAASDEDESLGSFARRHLGKEATARLVDAMQSGIFAADVEKLSVSAAFPSLHDLEQQHRSLVLGAIRARKAKKADGAVPMSGGMFTFEGGLEALTSALAQKLGERVRLHAEVKGLQHSAEDGWRLSVSERGRAEAVEPDQVVLATPSFVSSRLLGRVSPELAAEIDQIEYAPVTVVHIAFKKAELPAPVEGFGYLIPEIERRKILGAIYVSSVFPFRAPEDSLLLTCLVGGARHPEYAALDDGTLLRDVRAELALSLGIQANPSFVEIVRWPKAIPQYNVGHQARIRRVDELLNNLPGLHLHGHSYRGVGLNDCVRASTALAARMAPRDD